MARRHKQHAADDFQRGGVSDDRSRASRAGLPLKYSRNTHFLKIDVGHIIIAVGARWRSRTCMPGADDINVLPDIAA